MIKLQLDDVSTYPHVEIGYESLLQSVKDLFSGKPNAKNIKFDKSALIKIRGKLGILSDEDVTKLILGRAPYRKLPDPSRILSYWKKIHLPCLEFNRRKVYPKLKEFDNLSVSDFVTYFMSLCKYVDKNEDIDKWYSNECFSTKVGKLVFSEIASIKADKSVIEAREYATGEYRSDDSLKSIGFQKQSLVKCIDELLNVMFNSSYIKNSGSNDVYSPVEGDPDYDPKLNKPNRTGCNWRSTSEKALKEVQKTYQWADDDDEFLTVTNVSLFLDHGKRARDAFIADLVCISQMIIRELTDKSK